MYVYILKYVDANLFKCTYNFIDYSEVQTETDRCETTLCNTFTFIDYCYGVLINKLSWIGSNLSMDYVLMNKVFDE